MTRWDWHEIARLVRAEVAAVHGALVREVHSKTLKRWVTGSGASDKAAMRKALVQKYPKCAAIQTDDEIDARALLYYALAVPA